MNESETMGLMEAAEFLRIHPDTLAFRARAGSIPGCKVGRSWVFMRSRLREHLENIKKPGTSLRDLRRASEMVAAYAAGYQWTDRRGRQGRAVRRATPGWTDPGAIRAIYKHARSETLKTGVKHHVDHIIPLRHDLICGLHVEGNLVVVPALDNLRKQNRWIP